MTASRIVVVLCLFLLLPAPSRSQSIESPDIETHIYLTTRASSEPPKILGDAVLFSYRPSLPVRHVGVAFRHESFARVWTFSINPHGVFVLLYRPPDGLTELVYRFVVDGLWMPDPKNAERVRQENGIELSRLSIEGAFPIEPESPIVGDNGVVRLSYRGAAGQRVYVSGDFSNWDPFLYHLKETSPGTYVLDLPLPPGLHPYLFVVNGDKTTDPLNPQTMVRGDGRIVSVIRVR